MMLGLLLARAGVDVIVLEKHSDFLRDLMVPVALADVQDSPVLVLP